MVFGSRAVLCRADRTSGNALANAGDER